MNKFNVGDKVVLANEGPKEVGIVISFWYEDTMDCYEYYISFFGSRFPEGKPIKIPYVLKYLETSLNGID